MSRALAASLAALVACGVARAQELGQEVAPFELRDTRHLPRTLDAFGKRTAIVLVAVTRECPIVRRYLPALARLEAAYRERGVQVALLDVSYADDAVALAAFGLEHDLAFPIVRDPDGQAARVLGLTRTPEAVVLDANRVLRYRGRIDDQVRLGGAREAPTRRDLEAALEEVLAGQPVSVPLTPVDGCRITPPPSAPVGPAPTWVQDIAPLLRQHCADCHRAGGSAPFALTTYAQARRHGATIGEVVAERRMPPWYATGGPDALRNHRGLSADERARVAAWVAGGFPRGEGDEPSPPPAAGDWEIGTPDLVVSMPRPIEVAAEGLMPYQYVILPHRFEHDTWVQRLEIVAESDPEVLHHCNVFYLLPGKRFDNGQIVAGKVPGGAPLRLPDGVAVLIPQGALLGLQIHYQPIGVAVSSRLSLGLAFPRAKVQKRFRGAVIENRDLSIPPHAPHHRVDASFTFDEDVVAGGLFGHMHVRGKDVTFRATHPDGRTETLLSVPSYSFDWQMAYELATPRALAQGTRIDVTAHYDNSSWNPYNPDPTKTVGFGLQTTHEMLYCFVYYVRASEALDLAVDPATGAPIERR